MKLKFVLLSCFAAMFFMISCHGSSHKPEEGEVPEIRIGELGYPCYPNQTCNKGLICDEETNICVEDTDDSDSEQNDDNTDTDDSDTTDDSGDSQSDDADTASDSGDTDTVSDDDTDTVSDDDEDVTPARFADCLPKPEHTVWNDNGQNGKFEQIWDGSQWSPETYASNYSETAGICSFKCVSDESEWYEWDDAAQQCVNPCDPNPCTSDTNSTGECTLDGSSFICECKAGSTWITKGLVCKKDSSESPKSLGEICTGQTLCYNASSSMACPSSSGADFYGQDAQYKSKCAKQSFSSSLRVVVDNNTGLIWEKSPSSKYYDWANAVNHCADLNESNYSGISDWRIPNPFEFLTIVNNDKCYPSTNSYFTNMTKSVYALWTSLEYNGKGRYFKPNEGRLGFTSKTNDQQVLCVSGPELPIPASSDFETSSDGLTVTDKLTGLMWQKEYLEEEKIWKDALKYCEDLTYAGYDDWRLPNKNELASLLDPGKSAAPYSNFPGMPGSWFRSSSTYAYTTLNTWNVNFGSGNVNYEGNKTNFYIRCVRNAD